MSAAKICGETAALLETIGFDYAYQLPPDALELDAADMCFIESYLGWQIQTWPVFVVVHARTGHTWVPQFESTEDAEKVKALILRGVKADLARSLEVER